MEAKLRSRSENCGLRNSERVPDDRTLKTDLDIHYGFRYTRDVRLRRLAVVDDGEDCGAEGLRRIETRNRFGCALGVFRWDERFRMSAQDGCVGAARASPPCGSDKRCAPVGDVDGVLRETLRPASRGRAAQRLTSSS